MSRDHTDLQAVTNHNHGNLIHSELLFKIFRVTGISESLAHHRPLVDRSRDEHVNISVLYVLNGALQRCHCTLRRLRGRLSRLDKHIFRQTVHDIHPLMIDILRGIYHISVYLVDIVNLLFVESEDF